MDKLARKLNRETKDYSKDVDLKNWLIDYVLEFLNDEDFLTMEGRKFRHSFWKLYIKNKETIKEEEKK